MARTRLVGLTWPLPTGLGDDSLELLLFPSSAMESRRDWPVPDLPAMDVALRRPGVTLASNYTSAEATGSEGLDHRILAHVRMCAFWGGVPKAVVLDTLKSAVIKADRFDPGLNRLKQRWLRIMARRYCHPGCANLAARRKSRLLSRGATLDVAVEDARSALGYGCATIGSSRWWN